MIGCMYKGLGHEMDIFGRPIVKHVLNVFAQQFFFYFTYSASWVRKINIKILPENLQTPARLKDCSELELVRYFIKASRNFVLNFLHKKKALIQKILICFINLQKNIHVLTLPFKNSAPFLPSQLVQNFFANSPRNSNI